MKIGILEAGKPRPELAQYGTYADKVADFMARGVESGEFEFVYYAVIDGEFPSGACECDGWAVTGSRHGVYENLPWMQTLQEFIRKIVDLKRPLLGICFGHQIIATAMGGRVEKSDKGWGVGLYDYQITDAAPEWMRDHGDEFTLNAFHQDQVVAVGETGRVIASSAFCENAAIMYDDCVITFQGHPEFNAAYDKLLIEFCVANDIVPESVAEPALVRIGREPEGDDSALVEQWVGNFFRRGHL